MVKVKVYSVPTCPYCKKIKEFLNNEGIEFEDIDVSEEENKKEMLDKTGQLRVPQTEINGNMIIGYKMEKIKEELKNV